MFGTLQRVAAQIIMVLSLETPYDVHGRRTYHHRPGWACTYRCLPSIFASCIYWTMESYFPLDDAKTSNIRNCILSAISYQHTSKHTHTLWPILAPHTSHMMYIWLTCCNAINYPKQDDHIACARLTNNRHFHHYTSGMCTVDLYHFFLCSNLLNHGLTLYIYPR